MNARTVFGIVSFTLLAAVPCRADKIELRTGEVFFGDILRANEREVSIRLHGGGILSFRVAQVRSYRKDIRDGNDWKLETHVRTPEPSAPSNYVTLPESDDETDVDRRTGVGPALPEVRMRDGSPRPPRYDLVDDVIKHAEAGYRVAPPKGFLRKDGALSSSVVGYFEHPVTSANLTVLSYRSDEKIRAIKTRAAESYAEQAQNIHVVRDEPFGGETLAGWIFEVRNRIAGSSVRQIQVFTRRDEWVFVLTYSSPENAFGRYEEAFAESIRSLELVDRVDGADANAAANSEPVGPVLPEDGPPPVEDR